MRRLSWPFTVSLCLNAILCFSLIAGYFYVCDERFTMEIEAQHWAGHAGTMDCISDHDNGITRYYRIVVVPPTGDKAESKFLGERKDGVEVWSWPWYSNLGEASRVSTMQFVDSYNRRMENFVKESTTRQAE
jgi:hypothetical protein